MTRATIDNPEKPAMKRMTLRPLRAGTRKAPRCLRGIIFSREIRVPMNPPTMIAPWCSEMAPADRLQPMRWSPVQSPASNARSANRRKGILLPIINFFRLALRRPVVEQHSDGRGIGVVILARSHAPVEGTQENQRDRKTYPDKKHNNGHVNKRFVRTRKYGNAQMPRAPTAPGD